MGPQKPTVSFRIGPELHQRIDTEFWDKVHSPEVKSRAAFMEQVLELGWTQYQRTGSLRNSSTVPPLPSEPTETQPRKKRTRDHILI